MPPISNTRILVMATHGFEQSELLVPVEQLRKAGALVTVASLDGQPIRAWHEKDWGRTVPVDAGVEEIRVADFDALVLPGGQINPDVLRTDERVVDLVRGFAEAGKVIGAICHAPWLLIEASVVAGRRMTSYPSIRTDLSNAGATWVDEPVVVDDGIVTSRSPADLQPFVLRIIEELQDERPYRRVA